MIRSGLYMVLVSESPHILAICLEDLGKRLIVLLQVRREQFM